MTAGVQFINTDGFVQISDAVPNFVLLDKGSVALVDQNWYVPGSSSTNTGAHVALSIPNTLGYPPLIAWQCDTDIVMYRTRLVSGNWVYDLCAEYSYTKTNTIYWWSFGPPPNTYSNNVGLEVRTPSGGLAYHSDYKPLIIRDYQSQALGSSGSFNIGAGRSCAIAMLQNLWAWSPQVPAGTWSQFQQSSSFITSGSTGTIRPNLQFARTIAPMNFGWGGGSSGSWAAMAIDVTGY